MPSVSTWGETGSRRPAVICSAARKPSRMRAEGCPATAHASAHVLTWAIGLVLLDNCDFAALRRAYGRGTRVAGALVVSLLAIEGANGVNLNPLVLS